MNKYPSSIVIMLFGVACITVGALLVSVSEKIDNSPLQREPGAGASSAPALLSTIDLQRELNRLYPKLRLKEDGVYGSATKAAHERAIGDQYAKEFMTKEI